MLATMHVGTISLSATLTVAAFALLAINSCMAMSRALGRGDASAAMFVAASNILLAALLATVRAGLGEADAAAARRRRGPLKAASWVLSAALTGMFAHRAAALAPAPAVAVLVWSMGAATVAAGFYFLFVHRDDVYAVHRGDDTHVGGGPRMHDTLAAQVTDQEMHNDYS